MNLLVFYNNVLVGTINPGSDNTMRFTYSDGWKKAGNGFPISQSLPFSEEYTKGKEDHRFFSNLLPEAGAREAVCRALGISPDNDFELLAAIGGECAGALRIVPENLIGNEAEEYEEISPETIQRAVHSRISYLRLNPEGKLRLSLAGAQDKWPVLYRDGKLYWPKGGAPSSHILKLANHDFKGLTWNEGYSSFLASQFGVPCIEVLVKDGYTLTERYDRAISEFGTIKRIHQEDLCQALGYPSYIKYESENGPSLQDCIAMLRRTSIVPAADALVLLRWNICNLLLGNSDGHAKNLSILYTGQGPKLAPLYDIVCTRIYPGVSRNMAMSIGGSFDPGQIGLKDWNNLAKNLGMNPRLVLRTLQELIASIEENLDTYHRTFIETTGNDPIIDRINQTIRKQARRTKTLL
jgi:serine/threonine-protein kinase HipA